MSVLRVLTLTAFTAFPRIRAVRLAVATALGLACATAALAQEGPPVPLVERARGAEQIILGRVASVSPEWRVNDFGDRLIVTVVRVAVDETLKGDSQATIDIEVEGGTIGSLTLHVSDQQSFAPGDRAVPGRGAQALRRRPTTASPSRPSPSSANVEGSGTTAA